MSWIEAVVLALVQGLTEFLPISSSAHLILPSQLLGWEDQGLAFDVAVHVGTLLAIVLYFRKEVAQLASAWLESVSRKHHTQNSKMAWLIILATIPAGLVGALGNDFIDTHLRSSMVIAASTIFFALLLWLADRKYTSSPATIRKSLGDVSLKSAFLIGVSQAFALIPGTSRSGVTMTAALFLGFTREAAAKFSFFLSIPIITLAGMLKTKELLETGTDDQWSMVAMGALVAFISAYACIHWFLKLLDKIGFMPFVVYRLLLGAVLLAMIFVSS